MPHIMGVKVHSRKPRLKPGSKKIDGQRKTVHLGEKGDDKGRKSAKGPPVSFGLRLGKAKCKHDKKKAIDDDQRP